MRKSILKELPLIIAPVSGFIFLVNMLLSSVFAHYLKFNEVVLQSKYLLITLVGFIVLAVILLVTHRGAFGIRFGSYSYFFTVQFNTVLVFVLLIIIAFLTKTSAYVSREWAVYWFLANAFMNLSVSTLLVYFLNKLHKSGVMVSKVLLVSDSATYGSIANIVNANVLGGFKVLGYVSSDYQDCKMSSCCLGLVANIDSIVSNLEVVDEVWIAAPMSKGKVLDEVIALLKHQMVNIRFLPSSQDFSLLRHNVSLLSGLAVINISVTPMHGQNRILKGMFDRSFALIILILISPIMLLVAIIVKLNSQGPVFYKQERVGWNGRVFNILKFRSMPANVEVNEPITWGGATEKVNTAFGMFIRQYSIDELPQFINVLKGDMSIVGPRPERKEFVAELKNVIPHYMKKHLVKAGITGWAQVNGWRGDTDLSRRIEYDLYYIDNWSLWFDVKIILMTVLKGFIHKNAY